MLVPFDFEKVWKARDNRTQEKVLERNPVSGIRVGHLVLALRCSERVWVAGWCLMVSGSCSWVTGLICCLSSSLGGQHLAQVQYCKLGLLERGCWTIPRWWNAHQKTPAMVTEGLLWKEGRNCPITQRLVKYRPSELWEHYFQLELVAIFTLN